ncbi:MAG: hypothetical protein LBL33_04380 [Tannerella sp.]|jgi:hypothetical protein|nr:hypothetical protein [Tannerella sp.]
MYKVLDKNTKLFEIAEIRKLTQDDIEEYKTGILEYDSIKTAMIREEGIEIVRMEVTKECLREGLPVDLISTITKLSIEQIKDLLKDW